MKRLFILVENYGTLDGDAGKPPYPILHTSMLILPSYRNFLMACSALMTQTQQPLYFPMLESPLPPSIRNLQSWIEAAWRDGGTFFFLYDPTFAATRSSPGFDLEGQKELKRLVDTNKWIGTAGGCDSVREGPNAE